MFLNWITALVKAAVLKGFREAAEELELESDDASDPLESLKVRMASLPAPSGNGEGRTPRKAK